MTKNLFDKENAIYMGAKRSPENCSIGIFGVNYDGLVRLNQEQDLVQKQ